MTKPDVNFSFTCQHVVLIFKSHSIFFLNIWIWCSFFFADMDLVLFGLNQYLDDSSAMFQHISLNMHQEQVSMSHKSIHLSLNIFIQQISLVHAISLCCYFALHVLCSPVRKCWQQFLHRAWNWSFISKSITFRKLQN